jgi:hypothetical protein
VAGTTVVILSPDLHDIERTATSDAERRLARLLSRVQSLDAVAFHSVKLRSHAYKQMAEVDFVILWKGVLIVVEVKGGGLTRHEGVWYSVDRNRDAHRLKSSPIEQARSAMFALRDILREEGVGWFASEAIVVTPDIDAPPSSPEWKATHWLAAESMRESAFVRALDAVVASAQVPRKTERVVRTDELRSRLFGEFARLPVIDAQRGAVIDEQNRATEGQSRLLACLARNDRIVVLGGAGTGKSLVLAEAAKQEASEGRSVLITFRSTGLLQFFNPLLPERGIAVVPFDRLDSEQQYDVVFVDEAQDLMFPEAMDLLSKLVNGGRAQGRWRMFLDPNNQAQVDGRFDADVFELVASDAMSVDLSLNVRNTKAIVHMVQEYLGADVGDPGIVNGERIQWKWVDGSAGADAALRVAEELVGEGVRAADIWVIPVQSSEEDSIHGAVWVKSPRSAKGLEAEHVIVCDLPLHFDDLAMANFYVAVTRARVALHVIATSDDKKRLQSMTGKRGQS